ncbi:type 1 glutamine amidotransferase [Roseibium sp.]|uniref:type 1 glutamine amidotransferase n=1 Tax=Roseibium sp. TaxID=1936156 RepID=UPI003B50E6F7
MIVFDVFITGPDDYRLGEWIPDARNGAVFVKMPLLVIENYPKADLAAFGRKADAMGVSCQIVRAYAGEAVPDSVEDYSGLVVLGGGQNALADADYPFLPDVCDLILRFHEADRPVLGICLGCQLIARAFGGVNILARPIEFGWHRVTPTAAGRTDPVLKMLGEGGPLFHWHTDTVSLPEGAVHLAYSKMTPIQAFRMGRATYAIQFHFEAALEDVTGWSHHLAHEILPHTPDWPERIGNEARLNAGEADRIGAALTEAWLGFL